MKEGFTLESKSNRRTLNVQRQMLEKEKLIGKPGIEETRKGISEIEGKIVRVATTEVGTERVSKDIRDKGKAAS